MSEQQLQRRLAALICADVVGYSRLMADDEIDTVRSLTACRKRIAEVVEQNGGRLVDFVGDNMLAEFPNTLDAVNSADQIHRSLFELNANLPEHRHINFRIGIHIGDIMTDGERIYGDGVNIAARLQVLADPRGICISDVVYRQIRGKINFQFVDLGEKKLKNLPESVRVYRIVDAEKAPQIALVEAKITKRPPLSPPTEPSVTVLPFVSLSVQNEPDHFCDGLTLDIMAGLVQIPGLLLISWVSIGNYNLSTISVQEIGRQLGVSHVLDGVMRRFGNRVRITVRLVETSRGVQVWAKRFDCELDDIFAVQDKITQEIIIALDVQLVSGKVARVLRQALHDPSAIESYYRGWGALFRSSRTDIFLAQQMSEETIRLEPDSPLGYALSAFSHWWAVAQNASDNVQFDLDRAAELSHQAIHLNDVTGLPDLVLAQIHLLKREHDKALSASERSVKVRPSCHASYAVKANILNHLGRFSEAIELAEFAIRLYPMYPSFYSTILATAYYGAGRYEEAIVPSEISLSIDSNNLNALLVSAGANAALNRKEEAHWASREVLRVKPRFSLREFIKSQPYKNPQDLETMIVMLQKAGLPK
jgi:adenylate cyclase